MIRLYHLTPATTDADYGPEAITPTTSTSEEDLKHICNEYILSLQVIVNQASELTRATLIKIHPSTVCGSNSKDHD